MVRASAVTMDLLATVRTLKLSSWCIGAGVVRSLVWNSLHGVDGAALGADVDVVFYDPALGPEYDALLLRRLQSLRPAVQWEVTNQAWIHQWFLREHGQAVPPLRSLAEGVSTWPEYATCVGVALTADGEIEVIAPHGLDDLFELRVRHNPARASAEVFAQRVQSKRFLERWPMLSLMR
jgi:hypothetical protein